nr:MAG TPA: hypothetical protein [Caudoviricetes sp.]
MNLTSDAHATHRVNIHAARLRLFRGWGRVTFVKHEFDQRCTRYPSSQPTDSAYCRSGCEQNRHPSHLLCCLTTIISCLTTVVKHIFVDKQHFKCYYYSTRR